MIPLSSMPSRNGVLIMNIGADVRSHAIMLSCTWLPTVELGLWGFMSAGSVVSIGMQKKIGRLVFQNSTGPSHLSVFHIAAPTEPTCFASFKSLVTYEEAFSGIRDYRWRKTLFPVVGFNLHKAGLGLRCDSCCPCNFKAQ